LRIRFDFPWGLVFGLGRFGPGSSQSLGSNTTGLASTERLETQTRLPAMLRVKPINTKEAWPNRSSLVHSSGAH
jgi:hypothetical protein